MSVSKNTRWAILMLLALSPGVYVIGNKYGPEMEGPAVRDIVVDWAECDGQDLIAEFGLLKDRGQYRGMTIVLLGGDGERPRRTAWESFDQPEGTPKSKPPIEGYQALGPLRIEAGCSRVFEIWTTHDSDLGWWEMGGQFGPFGPFNPSR